MTGSLATKVIELVLIAPVVESLVLIGLIELLRKFKAPVLIQLLLPVALSCAPHTPFNHPGKYPLAWLVVLPFFLINGATYLYWRPRSFWAATWLIIAMHSLANTFPALKYIGDHIYQSRS